MKQIMSYIKQNNCYKKRLNNIMALLFAMVFLFGNLGLINFSSFFSNNHLEKSNDFKSSNVTLNTAENTPQQLEAPISKHKEIILDFQGGKKKVENKDVASEIIYARDYDTSEINLPKLENHAFYGYFSEPNAMGDKYYDFLGTRLDEISLNSNSPNILYAAWVKISSNVLIQNNIKIDEHTGALYSPVKSVELDISKLKEIGYNKIEVNTNIEVRAQDKGDGRDMWFDLMTGGNTVFHQSILENFDMRYTDWTKNFATAIIDSNIFNNLSNFKLGFNQTKNYFWTNAVWHFNKSYCTFTATDRKDKDALTNSYESLKTNTYNLEDNSGYNIYNTVPSQNILGEDAYANIGIQVKGGNIAKGDLKNGIQQYGYIIEDKFGEHESIGVNLSLNYNYNSIKEINGTSWEISEDSYHGPINGITGAGVVQSGAILVQKLKEGGNPVNSQDWTWDNPISGLTQSFHTADFIDNYSPLEYDAHPHYAKRIAPVVKRNPDGSIVYKYDEEDKSKIVGIEYEKDAEGNYISQDVSELIDGYAPIYTPSGSDLKKGLTLKVLFAYELKRKDGEKWIYKNIVEETTLSIYPSSAKILFQNMNFTTSSDEDSLNNGMVSSELVRQFGTVKDGHSVNDGFRVNFNGNTTYTVEYYKNGATNSGVQYAKDGQIFMEPGAYRFKVAPIVGDSKETIIYINDRGITQNLNKYFGENLITTDSHRVFSQNDSIPVYLSGKTYWSTLSYTKFSAPLVGRLGLSIDKQTEFKEEKLENNKKKYINAINYKGKTLYENEGYFKQDFADETVFFKIVEHIDASDGRAKKGILNEVGYYFCEFANNKDFFNNQSNLSGDTYSFVFQFRVTDKVQRPYINQQLLENNLSFVDMNSLYQAVELPTENSKVVYAFNNFTNAYTFAYNFQRSLVVKNNDVYTYLGQQYEKQYEVLAKVEEKAKESVEKRYFDASDADSYLTTKSNVHCAVNADGIAELQIREPIKNDKGEIIDYKLLNVIDTAKAVIVFDESFLAREYKAGEPFLNDKPFSYIDEFGVIKSGANSIRFVQIAENESSQIKLTHIEKGLNWIIPYGIPVQEFLENKKAPSGRYKITETNLDATNDFYGIYIAPSDNTASLEITRVSGKNQTTQRLTKANANIRFENINGLTINSAANELDPYGIVKIKNLSTNVTNIMQLDEMDNYKIEEVGRYEISAIDRLGNKIVFYADIYDATKFYDLTLMNSGELVNKITVGGGTRVKLIAPSSNNSLEEFIGWRDEEGNIIKGDHFYYGYTKNVTLTAVWHFKDTIVNLYDGKLLKEYNTKPNDSLKLEDLYGTSKDGLEYFRYVYQDENGVKHFYLPQIGAVPNAKNIRLDTLWKDASNPITASYGDKLNIPTKEGYVFYGYIHNNDTLFYDTINIETTDPITLYALFVTDANYVKPVNQGFVAGITNFFNGAGRLLSDAFSGIGGKIVFLSVVLMFAVIAFMAIRKKKYNSFVAIKNRKIKPLERAYGMAAPSCKLITNEAMESTVLNESNCLNYTKHKLRRKTFSFPKLTYKSFGISAISCLLVFVLAFMFNHNTIFSLNQFHQTNVQQTAIEHQLQLYNDEQNLKEADKEAKKEYTNKAKEFYKESLSLEKSDVQNTDNTSNENADLNFLNSLVKLNLEDLGFYVYKTTLEIEDQKVSGWLYTQSTFNEEYQAYVAGFVAFAEEEFNYWLIEEHITEYDGVKFILVYNEMINTMHYKAFDKYVYYSVDDYEISFDIVNYDESLVEYNYGYFYNYNLGRAEYDPNLGKKLNLSAYSTIKGINYDFAIDYYNSVIANQNQYAVSIDSVTMVAIDVATLNEVILSGQDESLLGISAEQIYMIESQLTSAAFYYVDGVTGNIQTIDTQDILDVYYAEAHKDDVTFMQVLNWVLIYAQVIGGTILICTGVGAGVGALLVAGGVLGIIAEVAGPQIQGLIGGVGVTNNGISAITIGIQLVSKWPIGTIAGLVCIGIGASTAFFGINDITESVWGDNLIKDVWGMSEDAYKWTELGLNIASTVCTIGGSALNKKLNSPKPKPPVDTPEPPVARGSNNPNTAAAAKQGRAAHTNAKKNPADVYPNGDSVNFKTEHTIKSGKGGMRPDGIDFDNKIIYELKPNNPAAIAKGKNQLSNYIARMKEIGEGDFVGKIITYDIIDGKVVFNK